jgi:hypothetical protein
MALLRHWFGPSPKEIVDRAIRDAATATAEYEEAAVKLRYYTALLGKCDPYDTWWRFAELAQAHHDAKDDVEFYKRRAEKAVNECDALLKEAMK